MLCLALTPGAGAPRHERAGGRAELQAHPRGRRRHGCARAARRVSLRGAASLPFQPMWRSTSHGRLSLLKRLVTEACRRARETSLVLSSSPRLSRPSLAGAASCHTPQRCGRSSLFRRRSHQLFPVCLFESSRRLRIAPPQGKTTFVKRHRTGEFEKKYERAWPRRPSTLQGHARAHLLTLAPPPQPPSAWRCTRSTS